MNTRLKEKVQMAVIGEQVQNAINYGYKKELTGRYIVIGCKDNVMFKLIDLRFYMGRSAQASVVYSSIWVHSPATLEHPGIETSGRGKASGCGYHKESQAAAEAIASAGISLAFDIGGVGSSAIREALTAIAFDLGYTNIMVTS